MFKNQTENALAEVQSTRRNRLPFLIAIATAVALIVAILLGWLMPEKPSAALADGRLCIQAKGYEGAFTGKAGNCRAEAPDPIEVVESWSQFVGEPVRGVRLVESTDILTVRSSFRAEPGKEVVALDGENTVIARTVVRQDGQGEILMDFVYAELMDRSQTVRLFYAVDGKPALTPKRSYALAVSWETVRDAVVS